MKTIYDPSNRWLGASPLALSESNKAPVAIDDTLSVLRDSGPITVHVLANDFDPESALLTLVSASAALGTAVAEADNTVTYTPPPGLSGFDTVLYTIADDIGQTRDGQVNVTITEPALSIDKITGNTLVVNAQTGLIDITITEPAQFAGTYQANTADLTSGPVNLVAPMVTGTVAEGQILMAEDGLWIHDTGAGVPTSSWRWLRDGTAIAGATSNTYTVLAADIGLGLSAEETLSDAEGQRSAVSAPVGGSGASGFVPSDDAALLGWWDADDTATITQGGGFDVASWADKAGGVPLAYGTGSQRPLTGSRLLNGRNVLDFNGAQMLRADRSFPVSGDVAFHMAMEIDSVNNAFAAILSVDATNDFQLDSNSATGFDGRLNPAGIGSAVTLSGGPFSGGQIVSLIFNQTGGQAEVYIGGILRATMAYSVPLDTTGSLHLMTNRSRNAWITGAVAELVVTETLGTRSLYHDYFAEKWGL